MKKLSITYAGRDDQTQAVTAFLRQQRVRVLGQDAKIVLTDQQMTHETDYHIDARYIADESAFLQAILALGPFREVLLQDLGDDF